VHGKAPQKPAPVAPKPPVASGTYTVVKGDNLTRIAARNGTTVARLVELNGIKNANLIQVGQVIKLG
jgi:LysM repeat protein